MSWRPFPFATDSFTTSRLRERANAPCDLFFRGPFGAFVSHGWHRDAVSAPFDDWWHNAYGLDVKILSPPHVLLLTGIIVVGIGSLILILGRRNLARGPARDSVNRVFLYVGAMILILLSILFYEYTSRVLMHSAVFYRTVMIWAPIALAGIALASWRVGGNDGCRDLLAVLPGRLMDCPFFPAEPKLDRFTSRFTHFRPLGFSPLVDCACHRLDLLRVEWRPQ